MVGARASRSAVKVAMSQVLIDVALGPEPKRVIQSALNKASGQAAEVQDGERRSAVRAGSQRRPRHVRRTAPARAAVPRPIPSCSACRKSLAPRFVP